MVYDLFITNALFLCWLWQAKCSNIQDLTSISFNEIQFQLNEIQFQLNDIQFQFNKIQFHFNKNSISIQ